MSLEFYSEMHWPRRMMKTHSEATTAALLSIAVTGDATVLASRPVSFFPSRTRSRSRKFILFTTVSTNCSMAAMRVPTFSRSACNCRSASESTGLNCEKSSCNAEILKEIFFKKTSQKSLISLAKIKRGKIPIVGVQGVEVGVLGLLGKVAKFLVPIAQAILYFVHSVEQFRFPCRISQLSATKNVEKITDTILRQKTNVPMLDLFVGLPLPTQMLFLEDLDALHGHSHQFFRGYLILTRVPEEKRQTNGTHQ